MFNKTNLLRIILPCLLVLIMFSSLFMPHYDTWISGKVIQEGFGIMYKYEIPEAGTFAVINGFWSLFAIVNLIMSFVVVIFIWIRKPHISVSITATGIFLVTKALLFLGNSAGWGAPRGDSMRSGHYVFIYCEIALIVISFIFAVKQRRTHPDDLIDSL